MRLPYIPDPPNFSDPDDQSVVERVKQRRGGKGLIALDKTLLHAPPVADGWNSFLGAIRTKTSLSTAVRETAICRVAVLNKAWYEWESHSPILESADGAFPVLVSRFANPVPSFTATSGWLYITRLLKQWARLKSVKYVTEAHVSAVLNSPAYSVNDGILSYALAAVLSYTDAMTLNVTVSDDLFANLKKHFNEQEIVEITATIAAYNCVSRFLVALDVGERNAQQGPKEGGKE